MIGFAAAWWGPVARYLGRLAAVLRRFDEAERHFEASLARDALATARKLGLRAPAARLEALSQVRAQAPDAAARGVA